MRILFPCSQPLLYPSLSILCRRNRMNENASSHPCFLIHSLPSFLNSSLAETLMKSYGCRKFALTFSVRDSPRLPLFHCPTPGRPEWTSRRHGRRFNAWCHSPYPPMPFDSFSHQASVSGIMPQFPLIPLDFFFFCAPGNLCPFSTPFNFPRSTRAPFSDRPKYLPSNQVLLMASFYRGATFWL